MVSFQFDKPEDSQYAQKYFWGRSPILCIAFLGCLGPLMMLGWSGEVTQDPDQEMWYDVGDMENPYVCEKVKSGVCGTWKASYDETKCYKLVTAYKKFDSAQEQCESSGATLAMPKSLAENGDVSELCGSKSPCWIGLKKSKFSGVWAWVDGTAASWTNWAESEPNNHEGQEYLGVIGITRFLEVHAFALFLGAVIGFVCVCINIGVVVGICACVYMALSGNKNDSLVMVAAISDAYCGFWLCISIASTVARMAEGSGLFDFMSIIFSLIEMILLCGLAYCGFQLRNKIQVEKTARLQTGQGGYGQPIVGQPGAVQVGQVVGQPVMGQPVTGTVVVNANPV